MSKRIFDLVIVLSTALFWVPVLAVAAAMVRVNLGAPVFFRQKRPGKDAIVFEMIKLRTMTDARDSDGKLLPDAVRLTLFGKFLRSTSLDELPELLNVLKGDMSLVGPRPLLVQYLERYTPEQMRRHKVRPGITGLAQVNGRNTISWEEKFNLDILYVETRSIWLDIKILVLTLRAVLVREGISAKGNATMPEFRGPSGSRET